MSCLLYVFHLGTVIPRRWMQVFFDDTVEHEAWNDSADVRVNLMVDFLRPGKTEFSTSVSDQVREYAEVLFRDKED